MRPVKLPRRTFPGKSVGTTLGAVLLGLGPLLALAATGDLGLVRVTDRVSLITGAGTNVVVLETPDGLALVDSGAPGQAEALLGFIDETYGGVPIRVLFSTHWHPDHTGANEAIAERGATIVAHENTRLWMATEYYVAWEKKNYTPSPDAALPTETFYSSYPQPLSYELGGYVIEYGHLPEAHTDGDIYVRFAGDDVIAVGDVLAVDAFPLFDYSTGGWIGGSQQAMRDLLELAGPGTTVIASLGAPQQRAALEAQLAMLDDFSERFRIAMNLGKGADEMLAEGIIEGYESLPDARRFIHNTYNGLWWGGRVRGPI
ncbi:MAG TPA: MBL fold metallo-hydrolase [Gammaproteobacteria bacterium]|nr:MBL fold metallo-hydrolase [Gammaproteobacteria bacterium]